MTNISPNTLAHVTGGSVLPNPCDDDNGPAWAGVLPRPLPDECQPWWRGGWV